MLLTLPNPKYNETNKYNHLGSIQMHDTDAKNQLSIHVIPGASHFAKIKMETCPRVGQIGEPFPEQTKMGWVIMSPRNDYEKPCDTVLGLKESDYKHDDDVYEKFKKQLKRDKEG